MLVKKVNNYVMLYSDYYIIVLESNIDTKHAFSVETSFILRRLKSCHTATATENLVLKVDKGRDTARSPEAQERKMVTRKGKDLKKSIQTLCVCLLPTLFFEKSLES